MGIPRPSVDAGGEELQLRGELALPLQEASLPAGASVLFEGGVAGY